jgi:1-acyl-sn-glycerol-3-phosphate acyltransferase
MKLLATLRLLAVYLTLGPLVGIVGIPWTLLTKNITWMYWAAMWVTRAGVRAAGIRVEKLGYENIPAGRACIFMCNHVSNLDPPVLLPEIPARCSVLLKKELMSIPILGTAMRMGGFIAVERGSGRSGARDAAQASVAAAGKAIADGLNIVVFPEGTRSLDGRLSHFKKGPFFLAMQTGAPIVPVAISGTEAMMRKGSSLITPGVATIRMLPAIEPGKYPSREELMAAVREAIAAALPEGMKPLNRVTPPGDNATATAVRHDL